MKPETRELAIRLDRLTRELELPAGVKVLEDDGLRVFIVGELEPAQVCVTLRRRDMMRTTAYFDHELAEKLTDAQVLRHLHELANELAAAKDSDAA